MLEHTEKKSVAKNGSTAVAVSLEPFDALFQRINWFTRELSPWPSD